MQYKKNRYDAFNLKILINNIEVQNYCINNINIENETNILNLVFNSWTFKVIYKTLEETIDSIISINTVKNEILYQGKIETFLVKKSDFEGYIVALRGY